MSATPDTELVIALAEAIPQLSTDEKRVVNAIVQRLLRVGREHYSPLDLARDERDWGKEAAEELADALFYFAAREVAANHDRIDRAPSSVEALEALRAADAG